jgi:dolichol kinase
MKDSSYDNNLRRLFHVITISTFAFVYGFSNIVWTSLLWPMSIAVVALVSFDFIRIHIPHLNWLIQETFSFLLRKHEFHTISAASWFLLAAMISVILFPKTAAALGFLYLGIGDPVASFVGIRFGKKEIGQKTWIGTIGFFLICWLAGSLWLWHLTTFNLALIIAGIPALAASLTERYVKDIDDNFAVPLVASSLLTILMAILI